MLLSKEKIEELLNCTISETKWQEIKSLEEKEETFNIKNPKDLLGQKFNNLLVIKRGSDYTSPSGKAYTQWWCICQCENKKLLLVRGSNLTTGNTKSCGCQNTASRKENIKHAQEANKANLSQQVFGELTAIRPVNSSIQGGVLWECRCSCGAIHYATASNLNAHRVESCGCITDSKGVYKIKKILNENNIPYTLEKTFADCKFPDSHCAARFDFYINEEFLLEYDGEQHFLEKDKNFFRDSLVKRQAHDTFKNEYCKLKGIPLKRIPYTELDNITLDSILGDKYLV